jgi:hypothetical protein
LRDAAPGSEPQAGVFVNRAGVESAGPGIRSPHATLLGGPPHAKLLGSPSGAA